MDLFKYHVSEEKIQLEIANLQKKALEAEGLPDYERITEEIC